jgi:subtilisin family serine protease
MSKTFVLTALLAAIFSGAGAGTTLPEQNTNAVAPTAKADNSERMYLVSFTEPALLESNPNALNAGVQAKAAQTALAKAQGTQTTHLQAASKALGLTLEPLARYLWTNNGVALRLTPKAALALAAQPGISDVTQEFVRTLQTDTGPAFVGAQMLWQDSAGRPGNRGAGVVVGIIDSGINSEHPSFAAVASDGYVHQNRRGQRFGLCATTQSARCNDKLIGLWDFTAEGAKDGTDLDGHGTHVAATAVGNPFAGRILAPTIELAVPVSGVAPRANLIAYKACIKSASGPTTCPGSALLLAIDQAAMDRVQVVNYSIGGEAREPFAALAGATDLRAMFNARAAGVVFSVAAGNEGPVPGSISSPANAPWVLGVANIRHRALLNTLSNLSASTTAPKVAFDGAGVTGSLANRAIVLAEAFGNARCSQGTASDFPPTGESNPFAPGTFSGQIVVCERGVQARLAKSFNVRAAGAGGMILVNTAAEAESIFADSHFVPSVHLGFTDGELLRTWLRASTGARGSISGLALVQDPNVSDVLNNSSSRGSALDSYLKPDLAAPGTDVFAADLSSGIQSLTGTSMAAPHVAGSIALLRGLHPSWGVDEVESAIRTSALSNTVREAGSAKPVAPERAGAGRLQAQRADLARLYFPLTNADIRAAEANQSSLNLPSLINPRCKSRCTFSRTVIGSADLVGRPSYSATLSNATPGLIVTMRPVGFSLGAGETQVLNFDVDVSLPLMAGQRLWGTLELTAPGVSSVALPVAVNAFPGVVAEELSFSAAAERGQINTSISGLIALPRPAATLSGFVKSTREALSLAADTTASDPFDNANAFRSVRFGVGGGELFATASAARDIDLYLGIDSDGDGKASSGETLCRQSGAASSERCRVSVSNAGSYWVLVHNPNNLLTDATLEYAAIPAAKSPSDSVVFVPGMVSADASMPLAFSYDLGASLAGEQYLALLALRADHRASAPMATTIIRLTRVSGPELPLALLPDTATSVALAAGEARSKIAFSVPMGSTNVTISGAAIGTLGAEIVRAPGDEAMLVGAAAGASALVQGAFVDSSSRLSAALPPGRYYLNLRNTGAGAASAIVTLRIVGANLTPLEPEFYHNPKRPGQGILLTRARNDAQFIFYTYDQLGQPTWYWFFADGYFASNPGTFTGPLLRYTWDGGTSNPPVPAGIATVTRTATSEFSFAFALNGLHGSEPMQLLARSGCATGAGIAANTDYTGAWYQPTRPGWGASIFATSVIEFVNFFNYDGLGQPRWTLGSVNNPSALGSGPGPITLFQHSGYCPTCAFVDSPKREVGSYRLKLDRTAALGTELSASVSMQVNFLAPLSGSFIQTGEFALLTGKKTCLP